MQINFGDQSVAILAARTDHPWLSVKTLPTNALATASGRIQCVVSYRPNLDESLSGLPQVAWIEMETTCPRYPVIRIPARLVLPHAADKGV